MPSAPLLPSFSLRPAADGPSAGTSTVDRTELHRYLLLAALSGQLALGKKSEALELWKTHHAGLGASANAPAWRLLRCHAGGTDCAAAFGVWNTP